MATIKKYIPLLAGTLLPLATFLNMQADTVPGWALEGRRPPAGVLALSLASLAAGVLATGALFVRMLERKIKWMTRLILAGAWAQGVGALAAYVLLLRSTDSTLSGRSESLEPTHSTLSGPYESWDRRDLRSSSPSSAAADAAAFTLVCAIGSLAAAALLSLHHLTSQAQWYSYTMYELSLSQRQLTLLMIASLVYMSLAAALYAAIERWRFGDALYWSVSTFATIGFGDFAPRSVTGRALIPAVTVIGIGLIGGLVWSLRNVILELLTLQLASQYSKWLGSDPASTAALNQPRTPARAHAAIGTHRNHSDGYINRSHHHNQNPRRFNLDIPQLGHDDRNDAHSAGSAASVASTSLPQVATPQTHPRAASNNTGISDNDETQPLLGPSHPTPEPISPSEPVSRMAHASHSSELFVPSSGMLATFDVATRNQDQVSAPSVNFLGLSSASMSTAYGQRDANVSRPAGIARPVSIAVTPRLNLAIDASTGMGLSDLRLAIPSTNANSLSPLSASTHDSFNAPFKQLPLTRFHTTSAVEINHQVRRQHQGYGGDTHQHTMTVSRSQYLPQVTIVADARFATKKLEEATHHALRSQILVGTILVLANIIIFGMIFAWLEQWSIWQGFYFAYIAVSTIGFGDVTLQTTFGRSMFIWYIFLAIGSSTYLGSMVAELALNEWIVTVDHIEKRVDRYERKAQLKKLYGKGKVRQSRVGLNRPATVHFGDASLVDNSAVETAIRVDGSHQPLVTPSMMFSVDQSDKLVTSSDPMLDMSSGAGPSSSSGMVDGANVLVSSSPRDVPHIRLTDEAEAAAIGNLVDSSEDDDGDIQHRSRSRKSRGSWLGVPRRAYMGSPVVMIEPPLAFSASEAARRWPGREEDHTEMTRDDGQDGDGGHGYGSTDTGDHHTHATTTSSHRHFNSDTETYHQSHGVSNNLLTNTHPWRRGIRTNLLRAPTSFIASSLPSTFLGNMFMSRSTGRQAHGVDRDDDQRSDVGSDTPSLSPE